MATGNKISKQKLNNRIKALPLPVQEHCVRCKLIAVFLLERIKAEDWFMDAKLNANHIASAVYYHDIGKVNIPRDNLYAEHNVAKPKQDLYRSHIKEGVALIERECGPVFENCSERSFENYVRQAILEHHESVDGCGFPNRLRNKNISTTGKITAIADRIDNLFFVGATEARDTEQTLAALQQMAGTELDSELLNIMLADREAFIGFINYIDARYRTKRRTDNYGLQLQFHPIRNIIENTTRAYLAEFIINDPFYGIVKPQVYMPVAIMASQAPRLTLLMIERLCLMLDRVRERGGDIPLVSVEIKPACFATKKFVPDMIKLLRKYGINDNKICLIVDERDLAEVEDVDLHAVFAMLRNGGYCMALNAMSENSTILTTLDSLEIDYLFIDSVYTHKLNANANAVGVASGVLEIAHNLHISVVFTGTDTSAIEKTLLKMRVRFATGEIYGGSVRETNMVTALVKGGGDAL